MRNRTRSKPALMETMETRELRSGTPFDLAWSIAPASSTNVLAGGAVDVNVNYHNVGKVAATNFDQRSETFLSSDSVISSNDLKLPVAQYFFYGPANSGQIKTTTFRVNIPATLPAGDYYLIDRVLDFADHGAAQQFDYNLSNNTSMFSIHVTHPAPVIVTTKMTASTPYGMRNQSIPFTVVLTDSTGKPLANQLIKFSVRSDSFSSMSLGSIPTDAQGRAILHYIIPKDVRADNIKFTADFVGNSQFKAFTLTDIRIQIGRPFNG